MTNDHETMTERANREVPVRIGQEQATLEVPVDRWLPLCRQETEVDLSDPVQAVAEALERPLRYPPLRKGLTPDDHVTVVVDERLPHLPHLLTPVLEHIVAAGIHPAAITLLSPPTTSNQPWIE